MSKLTTVLVSTCIVLAMVATLFGCAAPAPVKPATPTTPAAPLAEYTMPTFIDASGVYAELYTTTVLPATQTAYEGWNADIGSKIGVKINNKVYDTKYDFSEAANLYDRCVQSDKPIAINTLVSPATLANMKKFAGNKTPAIQWFGYSGMASPEAWLFLPGRAYVQQFASVIEYLATNVWKDTSRKPKVAFALFSGVYAKDTMAAIEPWIKSYDKVEFVGAFYHDGKPVDLTGYVRDIMKVQPDYIHLSTTSISLAAYYKALKDLGYLGKVVNIHPCYQGLDIVGRSVGFDTIEGDYCASTANNAPGTRAAQWFTKYADKYYKGATFGSTTVSYAAGTYLLLSAIEKAAVKYGASNITGQAVYEAINGESFTSTQLSGVASTARLIPADRLSGVDTLYIYKATGGKEVQVGTVPINESAVLKGWMK